MTNPHRRRSLPWLALLAGAALLVAAAAVFWPRPADPNGGEKKPDAPALFEDVTASSGVSFTYKNGEEADQYTILESLGGGVALIDYDGDGLLDIFLPGGGTFEKGPPPRAVGLPGRLYRNLGGFRFRDVTEEAGLAGVTGYTHGAAVADYDGDGRPDLLVTGYEGMRLYRNVDGKRFVDVTKEAGLTDPRWVTGAAFADLTGKGRPDLYVCRYVEWSFANHPHCPARADAARRDVCEPQRFAATPHSFYRNEGGKFVEASEGAGLRKDGKGLGVVIADFDEDGRPDVYVANDASDNFLYLNRGGRFEEAGRRAGVAWDDTGNYNGSMGVDAGDYDGSGRPSLWVTNFQGEFHALYLNQGKANFSYQTRTAGIAALGQQYVGFGTGFLDIDNDGWLDLVFVNGHVVRHPAGAPFRQKPVLLRNVERGGRRYFEDITARGGPYFRTPALGRGLAVGDLDNDGRPDLVVSHCNTPITILRNVAGQAEPAGWVGIQLVAKGGRPVIGARVSVEAGGRDLVRFARGGGSYLSAGDPRLLFGLGAEKRIGRVTVRWPWGGTETFAGVEAGRYWELHEGVKGARPTKAVRP